MARCQSTFLSESHLLYNNKVVAAFLVIIIAGPATVVRGWDADDFEVFDLVEEVGKNFYQVLDIPKDADQATIRKAYRRLSLQLHPDHNADVDAENTFRQLVAIYEVLKDDVKRRKYDHVLEVGLPDWRQPVFYYRRARKFGIIELAVLLFIIVTLGQYIVLWSVYLERKYSMEEVLGSKLRRRNERKSKKSEGSIKARIEEEICQIPKPKYLDLLPFMVFRGLMAAIYGLPSFYAKFVVVLRSVRLRRAKNSSDDESYDDGDSEHHGKPKRKRLFQYPEPPPAECILDAVDAPEERERPVPAPLYESRREAARTYQCRTWFDDDIVALTKAMVRFPVGTSDRWEAIGEHLKRPVGDVIRMAKTLKSSTGLKQVSASIQGLTADKLAPSLVDDTEVTLRDDGDREAGSASEPCQENGAAAAASAGQCAAEEAANEDSWSQSQQKMLEDALTRYGRGTEERWDKIASCVPDKSKDDCIARYKRLVEVVKKKRENVDR